MRLIDSYTTHEQVGLSCWSSSGVVVLPIVLPVVLPIPLPILLPAMDLLNGNSRTVGQERPPTIILDVPLTDTSVNIDFMQLAEQKYGWAAVHPVEARWKAAHGQDSEDESDSEQPVSGAEQPDRSKKRRRRNDMEYYDVEDPFIDDDELKLQETAAAAKDGFFVWHGPLVPEGERVRVERLGGVKKRKRPAKGQSSREKATAERAAQIAARQEADRQKEASKQKEADEEREAAKQKEADERAARAKEAEERAREERERQEKDRLQAIALAARPEVLDDTDSSDDERQHDDGQHEDRQHDAQTPDDPNKRKRSKPSAEVLAKRAAARREQRAAKKAAVAVPSLSVPSPSRQDSSSPTPEQKVDSPLHSEEDRTPVKRVSKPQTEEQKAAAKRRREKYKLNKLAQKRPSDDPAQARILAKAILNPAIDTSRIVITPALQQAMDEIRAEQATGSQVGSPSGRSMSVNALIS